MLKAKGEDRMNRLLEDLKISARVEEGPLGPYIGAKEKALAKTTPANGKHKRFRVEDSLLAFLKSL
jgi:hypothetical protein